jgi:hypothetical protein
MKVMGAGGLSPDGRRTGAGVMVEADEAVGVVTTFTVEPLDEGARSKVTIATDSRPAPGFAGLMEKLLSPVVTRRIFAKELEQLAGYVGGKNPSA